MRMIATLAAASLSLATVALSGCAGTATIDACKGAETRRQVYTTAIAVADAYVASGKPVPTAVTTGRTAAATALTLLDAHCPRPPIPG